MKYLFLLFMFSGSAFAEYQIDIGRYNVEHAWRGNGHYAQFENQFTGVGFTKWLDNGLGARFGYIHGGEVNTLGRYSSVTLNLKYIASLELLYREEVFNNFYLIAGISTNVMPIPNENSTHPHHSTDYDNDEGYLLEAQYRIISNLSLAWRFSHTSRIEDGGGNDEWTKHHSLKIVYTF